MNLRSKRLGFFDFFTTIEDKWAQAVADFEAKEKELADQEARMYDVYPKVQDSPELVAEWQENMNKIIAVQATIDSMRSQINTLKSWASSAARMVGLNGIPRRGLGALPAVGIPIVALLGVIGTMGAVIGAVSAFLVKAENWSDRFNTAIAAGMSPSEAAATADSAAKTDWMAQVGKTAAIGGALALAAIFLVPKLIKGKS